jgi:hypothetical protein
MDVTQTWMLGVVSVMAIFGAIALVGYVLQKSRK